MDTTGHAEQRLTTDMGYMDPTWSPDGQWIAYTYSPGHIYLMKRDGTEAHYLTDGELPSWSPDSRRIVFSQLQLAGLWLLVRDRHRDVADPPRSRIGSKTERR
jgi:Tol biopolymer transport system component